MKNQGYMHVRPFPWRRGLAVVVLTTLFIAGCYDFEFINQPYQSDADSYFEVEIQAWASYPDWGEFYFGVMLPDGWFPEDSTEFFSVYSSVSAGLLIYSESLSQTMASIDPPPEGYYWWVASGGPIYFYDYTFDCTLKIHTNSLAGTFWLDYMLGDDYQGINYRRSNGHLIVCGMPQACHPEGITLTNQDQVDCFQYNYPGCDQIAGSLTISGSDITSLAGLSNVTSIGGHLDIKFNNSLTNLAGLQNLQYIGGNVTISDNPSLVNLIGLSGLPEIVRNFVIRNNPFLASLGGPTSLTLIGQAFEIAHNPQLFSLSGLETLQSIGGRMTIEYNDSLASLSGLDNVIPGSITGLTIRYNYLLSECDVECICSCITQNGASLSIYGNAQGCRDHIEIAHSCGATLPCNMMPPTFSDQYMIDIFPEVFPGCIHCPSHLTISGPDISSLAGLHQFRTIGGRLVIQNNSILTSLAGLDQLESIGGYLTIKNNYLLSSLEGMEHLQAINGRLEITDNHSLLNLTGLTGIKTVNNELYIRNNHALLNLEGLENLSHINGSLNVISNNTLSGLHGLSSLDSISGSLSIQSNDSLTNLSGLEALEEINGTLQIYGNNALIDLAGMNGLSSIGGHLEIQWNNSLINLEGLDNLEIIGSSLYISNNNGLTGLNGIHSLRSIGNQLHIESNYSLVSLSGLNNLNPESIGNLRISNNFNLASCGEEVICNYLSLPEAQAQIYNNAPGCNSLMEIGYACGITLPCTLAPELFTSQQEIDMFPLVFPHCDHLNGSIEIRGEDITSLAGLSNIRSVGGDFIIANNPRLTVLTGLGNLNTIGWNLVIHNNDSLSSLTGMNNLSGIGNELQIQSNDALITLEGLEGVEAVGSLSIRSNYALSGLEGLENLQTLNGSLVIYSNRELYSLEGLRGLQHIGGLISINFNDALQSLAGLNNIDPGSIYELSIVNNGSLSVCDVESICGYLSAPNSQVNIGGNAPGCRSKIELAYLCGTALPCNNEPLVLSSQFDVDVFAQVYPDCMDYPGNVTIRGEDITNLDGLSELHSTGGNLNISYNDLLPGLDGLESLESVGGDLSIYSNPALVSLEGLLGLQSIHGALAISSNYGLQSLAGLDNIAPGSINSLSLTNNHSLSTCSVESICGYLSDPAGSILISENAMGCKSLLEVAHPCGLTLPCDLYPTHFTTQNEIDMAPDVFPGCEEIYRSISINGEDIVNLQGLQDIRSIGSYLYINGTRLTDMGGLENLESVGEILKIKENNELQNLDGFEQLQTIGSSLIIQGNDSLTSLEGLSGLASIGQNLTVESNNSLQSLTGLENLDPATISRLIIRYNPMLSECAIESVCGFLANPEANTSITDNQAGCNDRGEVEEACGIVGIAGPEAGSGKAGIDIFPNPASGIVYFRLDLSAPQRIIIRIFDISGREITLAADETLPAGVQIIDFDAAVLPEGLYFCRIVMGDQMETVKMVRW